MKKLLIATNVLLLSIILFQAHNQTNQNKSPTTCPSSICSNYSKSKPEGLINGSLAMAMSQAYSSDEGKAYVRFDAHHLKKIQKDALSISFDLEKIKNFIWQIEHAVCEAGCDSSQKLGIRFYYAKYPFNTGTHDGPLQLKDLSTECADKHTLFMVPEYLSKIDNHWYDFDYNHISAGCMFENILTIVKTGGKSDTVLKFPNSNFIMMNISGTPGDGDNHGGIAPPPDPGTYPTNPSSY